MTPSTVARLVESPVGVLIVAAGWGRAGVEGEVLPPA